MDGPEMQPQPRTRRLGTGGGSSPQCPCSPVPRGRVALLSIAAAGALRNPEQPQTGPVPGERDSWLRRGDSHPARVPCTSPRRARRPVSHQPHGSLAAPQSPSPPLSRFHLHGLPVVWRSWFVALLRSSAQPAASTQRRERLSLSGSGAATPGMGPGPLLSLLPRLPAAAGFQSKEHLPGFIQQPDPN